MQAMLASLEDAENLEHHIHNPDACLKANGLQGMEVPGFGDCQYLSLTAAAKKQKMNTGGLAEVRVKVFQSTGTKPGALRGMGHKAAGSRFTLQVARCYQGTGST